MKNPFKRTYSATLLAIAAVVLVSTTISSCRTSHKTKYGGPTADYKKITPYKNQSLAQTSKSNSSLL